jgi:hypothetical protein
MYYDRQDNPITADEFGRLHDDCDYRVIEKTPMVLGDSPFEVSTVWLGIDHSFGRGAPVIFESLVLGGPHDGDCDRYTTEDAAREGHMRIVQALVAEHEVSE